MSECAPTATEDLDNGSTSLQFEEFTWDDGNGGYQGVSMANFKKLLEYLRNLYPQVQTIEERVPYLVIWCDGSIPEPSKRPFSIAGLLAEWLLSGKDNLPPAFIGDDIGNLGLILDIEDDLADDIRINHIPRTETLCRLVREHFPDALAISFIDNEILVELSELSVNEHIERLGTLPGRFRHTPVRILYRNGLRITGCQHKHKRSKH
ncbi:hypothetical protein B7463_g1299, partial [Scytalidium lignicola]